MDNKTKMLIAVGASFTANCQPCLTTAVKEAAGVGVDKKEIQEAIAIGRLVRRGAMGKMDKSASVLTGISPKEGSDECPFGSTEKEVKEWINQEEPENQPECGCK